MSNRRKRVNVCAELDCRKPAAVHVSMFDDDGTDRGSRWLCRAHAVAYARRFGGRIWGDSECQCGNVDHIIADAGRSKHGDL